MDDSNVCDEEGEGRKDVNIVESTCYHHCATSDLSLCTQRLLHYVVYFIYLKRRLRLRVSSLNVTDNRDVPLIFNQLITLYQLCCMKIALRKCT